MNGGKTKLKIKIITLADEAFAIRREERKLYKTIEIGTRINDKTGATFMKVKVVKNHPLALDLAFHRRTVVRGAARVSLLAYGYLRGRRLVDVDRSVFIRAGNKVKESVELSLVANLVGRFGGEEAKEGLEAWIEQGRQDCLTPQRSLAA